MPQPYVFYLTRSHPSFVSKLNGDASKGMGEGGKNPNRFLPVTVTACLLSWFKITVLLANRQKQKSFLQSMDAQVPIRFFRLVSLSSQQSVL